MEETLDWTGSDQDAAWHATAPGSRVEQWWDGRAWSKRYRIREVPGQLWVALAGLGVAWILGFALAAGWSAGGGGSIGTTIMGYIGLWTGMVGACVVGARRAGGTLIGATGLAIKAKDAVRGLVGAGVARAFGVGIASVATAVGVDTDSSNTTEILDGLHSSAALVVTMVIACVGAPIVEEMFFRGLVQGNLVARWGERAGVVVTAVLFSLVHLQTLDAPSLLVQVPVLIATGLVLGILRERYGRLGPSMCAHAVFNLSTFLILLLT